jgi:fructan beta-fructosidase
MNDDALKLAWRPLWHFAPPLGLFMNDPNGLVYDRGVWHLFYQYWAYPGGMGIGWGHASSTDLARWTHLPIAIPPRDGRTAASGSAIVDEHDVTGLFDGDRGLVALYTDWIGLGFDGMKQGEQRQYLAYSRDDGQTWHHPPDNPVIPNPRLGHFRDPKLFFHSPTQQWIAVMAAAERLLFYASRNLRQWHAAGELALSEKQGGIWECPDLFELCVDGRPAERRAVVLGSQMGGPIFTAENRGWVLSRYLVGEFDGQRFTVNDGGAGEPLLLDHGPDCYAPVTWWTSEPAMDHRVLLGWMSNWLYATKVPTAPLWAGVMTMPRRIELISTPAGPRMITQPMPQLRALRTQTLELTPRDLSGVWELADCRGDSFELELEVAGAGDAQVDLAVRVGGGRETTISWRPGAGTLVLDRTRSHLQSLHPQLSRTHEATVEASDGVLRLHVFVDRCSVEVFADGGRLVMSGVVFPHLDDIGVELRSTGGTARLLGGRWHRLGLAD